MRPRAWRHGYELSVETRLKSGTLYPLLMRLSDRGLLDSKWQPADDTGRPPRHLYRLNSLGSVYARSQLSLAPPQRLKEPIGKLA